MTRALLLAATAALLIAAKAPSVPAPLPADAIDPALILPPPPAEGSVRATDELAELHRIEARRSAADLTAADADNRVKDVSIFNEIVGTDLLKLPQTAALFALVRSEEKRDADRAKALFQRKRPWIVDPSVKACATDDEPLSSYPSGHTTMGYSMGAVLARLVPSRAPAIIARAGRYGENRLVCEMHFRSDVVAGQVLGMLVAERLMADAAFRRQFDAAKAELTAVVH